MRPPRPYDPGPIISYDWEAPVANTTPGLTRRQWQRMQANRGAYYGQQAGYPAGYGYTYPGYGTSPPTGGFAPQMGKA